MTDRIFLASLRTPTERDPLRILMSACLTGVACGFDGTAYGNHPGAARLLQYNTVKIIGFCPEEFSFGTPREMCDIHGGNGMDVINGKAKVITESGKDWTEGMLKASERMLEVAINEKAELAVMMDISAACGSQVIYEGNRYNEKKMYQIGAGVCAARLILNGIKVISQRDFASLEIIFSKLDPEHKINTEAKDHHETDWYKEYFHK